MGKGWLQNGRGGGGGGGSEILPLQKTRGGGGGRKQFLDLLKGNTKGFGVVLTWAQQFFPF